MVTWGSTTVHTFGAPSPSVSPPAPASSTFSFGAASPAPVASFGSSSPAPSGLFGAPTPAPAGGLFGSSTSAPSSGSLFGSTSAPSTNLFGSTPSSGGLFGSTPSPGGLFGSTTPSSGGLFGSTPATGLFGTAPTTGGLFGNQQQQQQQHIQIPAQAALQAHLDASARQEEQRVQYALQDIHSAYQGTAPCTKKESAAFTCILYDMATPHMRQEQLIHAIGLDGQLQPIAPPQPIQVCESDWISAVVNNPDGRNYMPIAVTGSAALLARSTVQQEQANNCQKHLYEIESTVDVVQKIHEKSTLRLDHLCRVHQQFKRQFLDVMRRVEIVRCMNLPLQPDEIKAMTRLMEVLQQTEILRKRVEMCMEKARSMLRMQPLQVTDVPSKEQLFEVLQQHRAALNNLTSVIQHDRHDLELIEKRVSAVSGVPRIAS